MLEISLFLSNENWTENGSWMEMLDENSEIFNGDKLFIFHLLRHLFEVENDIFFVR